VALPYPGRVKVVWGDLSAPHDAATAPGGPEVLAAHTYRVPGAYTVVVTTYDGQGRVNSLHVRALVTRAGQPPAILAASPSAGPAGGGTQVAVIGAGMTGVNQVLFGAGVAIGVSVVSDNVVNATTAAQPAGLVQVTVTAPGRGTGRLPNGYTYTASEEEARRR
jgi:hypothetical protein